ncbi:MAG TPA: NADP-dependent oxidoreductase [Burkholderiaceae bacterium]|nr:NADP-dependent oxidoreductase [Burkholderiaceae bacterium]
MPTNRQVLLRSRPQGIPRAEHFELAETPLPPLQPGQFRIRNRFLSVDPAMRGWVSAVANYSKPVGIGEVMRAEAAGEVCETRHPEFAIGDRVTGYFGWQHYAVSDGTNVGWRVPPDFDLPLSAALGVLGMNGLTAYFGLLDVGQPKAGDTVVVSTAAGAVGSCVGQLARIAGCRAVGIAGGAHKAALCRDEFGFDAAIDYKGATDLDAALRDACPRGIDVYFDNTAGAISDAVAPQLNVGARVAVCGTASVSSWDPWPQGPRVERHLLVKRARMQGFLIFDYQPRFDEARRRLADWVRRGLIRYREDFLDGIDAAPDAIAGLYRGENLGKRLIRLDPY